MKLGFISDLHYDVNESILNNRKDHITEDQMVEDTLEEINILGLDYLFISGDITNSLKGIDVVKRLNSGRTKVYYVIGNHDVWSAGFKDTWAIYQKFLEDEYCLVGKELKIREDLSVVGMFSWYDGSFDTEGKSKHYYEIMKMLWADARFTDWGMANDRLSTKFIHQAEEVLSEVTDKDIILLNHFVPHKDFIIHEEGNENWNFGNGFMGTDKIMNLVSKDDRIKIVTFGHTHKQFGKVEKEGITFIGNPLGYVDEWTEKSFKGQLKKKLIIKEI